MKHLSKHTLHTLFGFLSSFFALVLFLIWTSPYNLPLVLLLVPSVLLGIVMFFILRLFQTALSMQRSIVLPIAGSMYIVMVSLLASLQQLTWKDGFLAAFLLLLGIFYYKRNIQS